MSHASNCFSVLSGERRERSGTLDRHIVTAVMKAEGQLQSKTPKDMSFRKLYKAVILSIYRLGKATRAGYSKCLSPLYSVLRTDLDVVGVINIVSALLPPLVFSTLVFNSVICEVAFLKHDFQLGKIITGLYL